MSRSAKIMGVIFCAAAVVFTAAAVLTSASAAKYAAVVGAVAAAVMFFLDRRAKQTGIPVKNGFMMLVSLFAFFNILLCSISPWVVNSEYKWQYPYQKAYIGLYNNIKEPEFFPDFMNDVRSGYEFDYLPSIMQGAGHYSVTFVTAPERAAEYAAEFGARAMFIISLDDYLQSEGRYALEEPDYENARDGTLNVYVSEGMKNGHGSKTRIYVQSAVLDFNHPHSSAVIADTETGLVQFTQLG